MRVVHLSYEYGQNNRGGAAMAATRLHLALLKAGVDSHFICFEQAQEGPNVHVLPRGWLHGFYWILARRMPYYLSRILWRFEKYHLIRGTAFSDWGIHPHIFPMFELEKQLREIHPDVLHIHWINRECLSFRQLSRLPYPMVFSLHDRWMINAFNPCPEATETRYRDGFTRQNSYPYERWMVRRKIRLNERLNPVYVAPSEWMCRECQSSVITRGRKVFTISNVMNEEFRFQRGPEEKNRPCVALFGCQSGTKNGVKGWPDLVAALRFLDPKIKADLVIRVFGEKSEPRVEEGVRIEFLGGLNTPQELCAAYNAADFLVLPSRQDNAPSVKFEAWLCGLPVIAFNRQGCAEGIEQRENGWVSPDGDVRDYAKGIEYFYGRWKSGELNLLHREVAENARQQYSSDNVISQYLDVYRYQIQTHGDKGSEECMT